ncbi:hypothetical protein LABALGNA3A7_05290 [Dellaglioa algida]|nr:hypothetical protein LABALGNA3A7_05290 [Dellaglioa algida]
MNINEFDLLLLKNGKQVVVVYIFEPNQAFEVEPKPNEDGRPPEGEPITYSVKIDEVDRKLS